MGEQKLLHRNTKKKNERRQHQGGENTGPLRRELD